MGGGGERGKIGTTGGGVIVKLNVGPTNGAAGARSR